MNRLNNVMGSAVQQAHLVQLLGRTIVGAKQVVCGRPYAVDVVLELDDGSAWSFCGEYDENTVIQRGDHGG